MVEFIVFLSSSFSIITVLMYVLTYILMKTRIISPDWRRLYPSFVMANARIVRVGRTKASDPVEVISFIAKTSGESNFRPIKTRVPVPAEVVIVKQ